MAEDIRIWEIVEGKLLNELRKSSLDHEDRLEEWIAKDVSIISHDLITIGRQIQTDFGGVIDLLCLDLEGNTVIVELKRGHTPRDVVAQVLDYASWIKDLSNEQIRDIANDYLKKKLSLEDLFKSKFEEEIPEILNENHKLIIVSAEIDETTERIINYLSDSYGVAINAISFKYFKDNSGKEYLARTYLIEPSEVERKSKEKKSSKRKPPVSFEEFQDIAEKNGVGHLFVAITEGLSSLFDREFTTGSTVSWAGILKGSRNTILNILPKESNSKDGLRFYVYIDRLAEYLDIKKEEIVKNIPGEGREIPPWKGASPAIFGHFRDVEQVNNFIKMIKGLKKYIRKG